MNLAPLHIKKMLLMYDCGPQVIAKNSDWFIMLFAPVHLGSVNYLINYLQIIDLLATDKSRYFTHPRSIIINYVNSYSLLPKQGCEALMLSPQLALCLGLPTCINYS